MLAPGTCFSATRTRVTSPARAPGRVSAALACESGFKATTTGAREMGVTPGGNMSGPKETVYDEQIAPLMAQIIEIAQAHGIAALTTFQLDPDDDGSTMLCTTHLSNGAKEFPFGPLFSILRKGMFPPGLRMTAVVGPKPS